MNTIQKNVLREDAPDKISGSSRYIQDIALENMIYAKTIRSSQAKAKIEKIELPEVPPGYSYIDFHDVPGVNGVSMINDRYPVFAEDSVNYIGEPIALIAGPDREVLRDFVSKVKITYSPQEPVFSLDKVSDDRIFNQYSFTKGDPAEAFTKAKSIIEYTYRTGYQEHMYLEPQGMIAEYTDNRITVYGSMQCPYYVKTALQHAFAWPEDRFRVVQTTTGGAFGGKEEFPSIIALHAAVAAYKTGKPVSLVYNRREDVEDTTKRHPSIITYKTGIDENNRIAAMDIHVTLDAGAYEGLSGVVLQRALFAAAGTYEITNLRISGKSVQTNTVPTGAFRGFGAPQAFFGIEMHMQHCAKALGEEPLDFKRKHLLTKGSSTATEGKIHHPVVMPEMIEGVKILSDYERKKKNCGKRVDGQIYGIGCSLFFHGCGFTGSGERDKIKAKVRLRRREDHQIEILIANVEMGQGPQTTLKKVVSQAAQVPLTRIVFNNPDTDKVPDSGPTVASRTAMVVGYLLQCAGEELFSRREEKGELIIEKQYVQPDFIVWDQDTFKGDAYPTYSWGVNVAEVGIDPVTMEISVDKIYGIYDIGKALDKDIVRGQMEGGIAQGVGWATIEVMEQQKGAIAQSSMTDYIIPTVQDLPEIILDFIDNPYEFGAYGAKGAGEIPLVGAPPAVASAVENALGFRIHKIPIKPEELLEAQQNDD